MGKKTRLKAERTDPFTNWFRTHVRSSDLQPAQWHDGQTSKYLESGIVQAGTNERLARQAWNKFAPHYNQFVHLERIRPQAKFVIENANLKPDSKVMSMAGGTSILETFIAKHKTPKGTVISVDLSEKMGEEGKKLAKKTGTKNIHFVTATSTSLPIKSNSQNIVPSIDQRITDHSQVHNILNEAHRVITKAPESRFLFSMLLQNPDEKTTIYRYFHEHGFAILKAGTAPIVTHAAIVVVAQPMAIRA